MTIEKPSSRSGFGSVFYAVIAIICAGFAAYLMAVVIKAKGYKQEKKVPVVVAESTIEAGQRIAKEHVKVVQMPQSLVPDGAVTSMATLFPEGGETKMAATVILKGEMVASGRLGDPKKGTALAGRVRDGYRAIAVTVDKSIARSPLLYPGAHVDVIGTVREMRTSFSRLLVEDCRVLSLEAQTSVETTNERAGDRKASDAVVAIEVTPEQAEIVALIARQGEIDLVLRNAQDDTPVVTPGISTMELAQAEQKGKSAGASDGKATDATASNELPRRSRRRSGRRSRKSSSDSTSGSSGGIEVVRPRRRR